MQNDDAYYMAGWDSHLENLLKSTKKVCPHCGKSLDDGNNFVREFVKVRYKVQNTWPYSMDDKSVESDKITEIEIPLDETFVEKGKRYYRMVLGHGTSVDLLVES